MVDFLDFAARMNGAGFRVDSEDRGSWTFIVFAHDGAPYEVRVRRVTEEDVEINIDGVIPDAGEE